MRSVNQVFREVYKKGGVVGLWRGAFVNVQRAALVNLGDLTTYDYVKKLLMKRFNFSDNFYTHTISR
jgi:solute carrier family 25 uncoupling protein 27